MVLLHFDTFFWKTINVLIYQQDAQWYCNIFCVLLQQRIPRGTFQDYKAFCQLTEVFGTSSFREMPI